MHVFHLLDFFACFCCLSLSTQWWWKHSVFCVIIPQSSIEKSCEALNSRRLVNPQTEIKGDFFFLAAAKHIYLFLIYFIFKLYNIVLVLPNIEMNPPQVYLCSPSWTLLPPPSPYPPSGSSQCTSPKHPVSCIEPGLVTRFIHDIIHVETVFRKKNRPGGITRCDFIPYYKSYFNENSMIMAQKSDI